MLVIYQESLHDAWSTKCKIFKSTFSLMNGKSDYMSRAPQTKLHHCSERISTHYHIYCYGLTKGTAGKSSSWISTVKITALYSESLFIHLSVN